MLQEGVLPALIENAGRMAGMPVGPLVLLDELTLDLPLKIVDQAIAEEGAAYTVPPGAAVMRKMKDELKRPSKKAGGGFYDYPEGGKKALWTGLKQAFPPAAVQPELEEVKKRLLYIQSLETARCLEEGVLSQPADADLGSVLAWGFPTYTGGTLSLIDTVGPRAFVAECDRLAQAYGPRFQPTAGLRDRAANNQRYYA
jgi:3-hydroxyacyl-CoA dehydrogenase/enoyl-CoA hydratase/3-hydroxybutyryl-CoA epimerase